MAEELVRKDKLTRRPNNKPVSAETIGFKTAPLASASASVANGDRISITVTLSNPDGLKVFAIPEFSVYEGSVASVNRIPSGANIAVGDYVMMNWNDYGLNDNANLKYVVVVENNTGSTQTIYIDVTWRYIIESAT